MGTDQRESPADPGVDEAEPIELAAFSRTCWQTVETGDATLVVEADRTINADRTRVRQLFESGYSTAANGTGFGLAIVRDIVEAHGWEIEATESDAGGARVEITGVESA